MTDPGADIEILRLRVRELEAQLEKHSATRTFTRSQLRDPSFFAANKSAILAAAAEGRIVDDSAEKPIPSGKRY